MPCFSVVGVSYRALALSQSHSIGRLSREKWNVSTWNAQKTRWCWPSLRIMCEISISAPFPVLVTVAAVFGLMLPVFELGLLMSDMPFVFFLRSSFSTRRAVKRTFRSWFSSFNWEISCWFLRFDYQIGFSEYVSNQANERHTSHRVFISTATGTVDS